MRPALSVEPSSDHSSSNGTPAHSSWPEQERYVLARLDEHGTGLAAMRVQLHELAVAVAELRGKVGLWGTVVAAAAVLGGVLAAVLPRLLP